MRHRRIPLWMPLVALALLLPVAPAAHAQSYSQLQILLPGENPAPGTATGRSGSPDTQTVGVPFTARVRAVDASFNLRSEVGHSLSLATSDASGSVPASIQLVGGEASFEVTWNADGSFRITADDQTDPTIPQGVSSTGVAVQLQGFEFSRINQKNQYAGTPQVLTVRALDPEGNVVSGYHGPVVLQQLTSYGIGRVSPSQVQLSGGTWTGEVTCYRADETSINRGNVNVYAFLAGDPTRNGTSDPFTVHPGLFARLTLVVPGQTYEPGSVAGVAGSPATQGAGQGFSVEVYATDTWFNQVPSGDTVRLSSNDGAASTPISRTLSNGYASIQVSLGTVGDQTLTVSDTSNGSIQGMTSAPIAVIPDAIAGFAVEPFSTPVQAGDPVTVTLRAVDGSGNTVPTYDGTAQLAANTGPSSIEPERVDFVDGTWTGTVTFYGAGNAVSFNVSDFASPPRLGTSGSFQVVPGPLTGLQVLLPGQTARGGTASGYSGEPDAQAAGSSFNLRVRAVDAWWNRVPGVDHAVQLSSSDLYASFPGTTVLTDGEGLFNMTLFRAGDQTVSATDLDSTGLDAHTSRPLVVTPGPYARLLVVAPGENVAPGTETGRDGEPTDQSINYSFTVTVHATDQWFNPVGGVTDVVRIGSNDPLAELPADAALVDGSGEFVMRLSTGGYQQITASNVTDPAIPSSTTEVRAISSGFHLEAEVDPTTVQAGQEFQLTVKVTNDAGSVIQEINSAVELEVRRAGTQEGGRGQLSSTTMQLLQGRRTVSLSYTFAEPIQIIARDDMGNDPAITEVITVVPGDPVEILLGSDPRWVGGNKHATVSARVVDAFDNGVPDQPVDFALAGGAGSLLILDPATDEAGVSRADYLSPRTPGTAVIVATSGDLTAQLELEVALVDPDAAGGHITNYPNPFHPSEGPTTLAWKLDDNAAVRLRIYTLTGGLVVDERFARGTEGGRVGLNTWVWDGRNGSREIVASGGYLAVVEAEGNGETLHVMRRKIGVVR